MNAAANEKPSLYLIFSVFVLALVNMQDGFDILAISYAANAITQDWGLSRSQLGIVFSAGLLGMMLGAIFLSSLADKFGRKTITIVGLFISGVGMLIAMGSGNIQELVFARIFTGFGVGGILASVNTLVSEYAGEKYRTAAISLFQLGFSFGAFVSGFIAAWLLDIGNWRFVFAFGALTSFVFIPVIFFIPESTAYIASKGGDKALEKINSIRHKFGQPALYSLTKVNTPEQQSAISNILSLFGKQFWSRTLLIWTAFFLLLTTLYFLLSWVPKMIVDMGYSELDGNRGGRLINLMGIIGIIFIGILGFKFRPALQTSIYLLCLAALLLLFSSVELSLFLVLLMVSLIGIFAHGSMIGIYSTVPGLYPAGIRATGTGWAIGISRFGAILGPAFAGYLFDEGLTAQEIFKLYSIPAAMAAIAIFCLWCVERRQGLRVL